MTTSEAASKIKDSLVERQAVLVIGTDSAYAFLSDLVNACNAEPALVPVVCTAEELAEGDVDRLISERLGTRLDGPEWSNRRLTLIAIAFSEVEPHQQRSVHRRCEIWRARRLDTRTITLLSASDGEATRETLAISDGAAVTYLEPATLSDKVAWLVDHSDGATPTAISAAERISERVGHNPKGWFARTIDSDQAAVILPTLSPQELERLSSVSSEEEAKELLHRLHRELVAEALKACGAKVDADDLGATVGAVARLAREAPTFTGRLFDLPHALFKSRVAAVQAMRAAWQSSLWCSAAAVTITWTLLGIYEGKVIDRTALQTALTATATGAVGTVAFCVTAAYFSVRLSWPNQFDDNSVKWIIQTTAWCAWAAFLGQLMHSNVVAVVATTLAACIISRLAAGPLSWRRLLGDTDSQLLLSGYVVLWLVGTDNPYYTIPFAVSCWAVARLGLRWSYLVPPVVFLVAAAWPELRYQPRHVFSSTDVNGNTTTIVAIDSYVSLAVHRLQFVVTAVPVCTAFLALVFVLHRRPPVRDSERSLVAVGMILVVLLGTWPQWDPKVSHQPSLLEVGRRFFTWLRFPDTNSAMNLQLDVLEWFAFVCAVCAVLTVALIAGRNATRGGSLLFVCIAYSIPAGAIWPCVVALGFAELTALLYRRPVSVPLKKSAISTLRAPANRSTARGCVRLSVFLIGTFAGLHMVRRNRAYQIQALLGRPSEGFAQFVWAKAPYMALTLGALALLHAAILGLHRLAIRQYLVRALRRLTALRSHPLAAYIALSLLYGTLTGGGLISSAYHATCYFMLCVALKRAYPSAPLWIGALVLPIAAQFTTFGGDSTLYLMLYPAVFGGPRNVVFRRVTRPRRQTLAWVSVAVLVLATDGDPGGSMGTVVAGVVWSGLFAVPTLFISDSAVPLTWDHEFGVTNRLRRVIIYACGTFIVLLASAAVVLSPLVRTNFDRPPGSTDVIDASISAVFLAIAGFFFVNGMARWGQTSYSLIAARGLAFRPSVARASAVTGVLMRAGLIEEDRGGVRIGRYASLASDRSVHRRQRGSRRNGIWRLGMSRVPIAPSERTSDAGT